MTMEPPVSVETAPAAIRPTGAALAFNPVLHGLRGLAAMAVLLYHWRGSYPALAKAWQDLPFLGTTWDPLFLVQFGWIGVNWFFVLSGYLLAANLWRATLNPGQVLHFYQRRALRIYPGLWAQLLILLPFVYLTGLVSDFRWQQVLGNALLWFAPMPGGTAIYNGVYWTLPLELSFYLALPFMILFYRRTGVWTLLLASLAITLVWRFGIAGLHHSSFSFHPSLLFIRNVLPGVLFVFATGMTLNVSEHRLADKKLQRLTQRIVHLLRRERLQKVVVDPAGQQIAHTGEAESVRRFDGGEQHDEEQRHRHQPGKRGRCHKPFTPGDLGAQLLFDEADGHHVLCGSRLDAHVPDAGGQWPEV